MQWQFLSVSLGWEGLAAIPRDQMKIGNVGPSPIYCSFGFPSGEGMHYGDSLAVGSDGGTVSLAAPPALRTGKWYDVAVVLLPDGRCAGVLDGTLVRIGDSDSPLKGGVVAMISGMSVGTHNLVGPVRISQGIPPDVLQAIVAGSSR
jgi:hypothetical protein